MAATANPDGLRLEAADGSQKPVVGNLIQLYLYDMAARAPFPVGESGRYGYDLLDRFWEHPYLLRLHGQIAGFALVIGHCPIRQRPPCWFMAEFCVLRPYWRRGVGRGAVRAILAQHPGDWEIAWSTANRPAAAFWQAVIPEARQPAIDVAFDGTAWTSVPFTSRPHA